MHSSIEDPFHSKTAWLLVNQDIIFAKLSDHVYVTETFCTILRNANMIILLICGMWTSNREMPNRISMLFYKLNQVQERRSHMRSIVAILLHLGIVLLLNGMKSFILVSTVIYQDEKAKSCPCSRST